jgi:hypothetical protein
MNVPETLRRIVAALDETGISYMLTGSFASAHYGVPRSTQDIDIVIEATDSQLRNFVRGLHSARYYAELDTALDALRHESLFNVIDTDTGWKIDLIIRKDRPFSREELGRRRLVPGLPIFVASPEDVIVAKLEWAKLGGSQRQIEDAAAIIRIQGDALDKSYLEKWISELELSDQWMLARRSAGFFV